MLFVYNCSSETILYVKNFKPCNTISIFVELHCTNFITAFYMLLDCHEFIEFFEKSIFVRC